MKTLNKIGFIPLLLTLLLVVMMVAPTASAAASAADPLKKVELLTTSNFAVLAYSKISDAGAQTQISGKSPEGGGDVGLSPTAGTAITGLTTQNVGGTIYAVGISGPAGSKGMDPAKLTQAKNDLDTAYNDAATRPDPKIIGPELGGLTLYPGVYRSNAGFNITGTLTLDTQGDPEGVFIFQTGASTLITATDSNVKLVGAKYCRVFWQVGSSATLGTYSHFVGHIFAYASIAAQTGATVQGQLLAKTGAVTLDHNTIINGLCDTPLTPAPGTIGRTGRTVAGGQLSNTSTHLYELLLIGAALTLVGAVGWISRKRYE